MAGTVWTTGGCASWYLDDRGRNTTLWPGSTWRFRRQTRPVRPRRLPVIEPAMRPEAVRLG